MIDYLILGFVLLVLGLIIYFKWIKKSEKTSCHCYKAKSCGIKLEELRKLFNNHEA
ncbi:MAG: hypothetical protein WC939_03180 [Acholeplasmataceae bacterium]